MENLKKTEILEKKAKLLIEYMNKISGHKWTFLQNRIKKIMARLKDREYRTSEILRMLKLKWREWKETENEQYFQPSTIFRPSHFDEYIERVNYLLKEKQKRQRRYWTTLSKRPKTDIIKEEPDKMLTIEEVKELKEKILKLIKGKTL